ncbi:MAG TPA: hypothetical protein VHO70_07970 [Chitinispirillaceae bacterium]|nr:hypothetical protein [Chitinispirillaceae bacterium]
MKCIHCGKPVNGLSNFGSDINPSCYDCAEKQEILHPKVDLSSVDSFLDGIKIKKNTQEFRTSRLNYPYFIVGLIGVLSTLFMMNGVFAEKMGLAGWVFMVFFLILFMLPFGLICMLVGLAHVQSTINLSTRQITITRRNLTFFKRKVTDTFALEELQINAICFPDTPTTWMVRVGCGDFAFISKEFYSVQERNAAMLGILKKLFPEFSDADESWIIEEGNSAFFREIVLPEKK